MSSPQPLSPLPWRSEYCGGVITSVDGLVVGLVRYSKDAELVTCACNAHQELVAALRGARDCLTQPAQCTASGALLPDAAAAVALIDAALAKAGAL